MLNFVYRLLYLITGICWLNIWLIQALVALVLVGPKKLFDKSKENEPPAALHDPVYGEHKSVTVNKVKLHYVVSGPTQAPLMLMLHGFPEIWYSWRYQIKEFQKDFRVVAVDMRGYGDSDKPKGLENYKMDVLVQDVQELIEALGYRSCVLVSHDWGGAVAWAFASIYPEMVDRLVVMNMAPAMIWKQGFTSIWNLWQFLSSGYIYLFHLPYLPEILAGLQDIKMLEDTFLQKPFGVHSGLMTKDDVECYKYYYRKPGPMIPLDHRDRFISSQRPGVDWDLFTCRKFPNNGTNHYRGTFTSGMNYYRANLHIDSTSHGLNYPMPVQIIWGCQDQALTMKLLEQTAKAVPHARVAKIKESSHWVQMDQPDKVCIIMRDFLLDTGYHATQ